MQALPSLGGLHRPSPGIVTTPGGRGDAPTTTPLPKTQTPGSSYGGNFTPSFIWNATAATPTKAPTASVNSLRSKESVQDVVTQHEQDILDRTLAKATAQTRADNDKFLEQQVESVWNQDLNAWLSGLVGPRFVGGDSTSRGKAAALAAGDSALTLPPSTTNDPNAWTRSRALTRRDSRQAPLDPNFAVEHWRVITNTSHPMDIADSIKSLAIQASRVQNQAPVLKGYATALDLTLSLLEANDLSSPVDLACRTLVHFSQQFEDMMVHKVQAGIRSGAVHESNNYTEPGARTCELYVKLILGPNADVWTMLYYCLRIGDAAAAYEIWMNRQSSEISDALIGAISSVLQSLCRVAAPRLWEKGIPDIPIAERNALKAMADQQSSSGTHFKGVFALLTGYMDLPIEASTPGFCDMEDSLFGGVWKALLADSPVTALENFGENIQSIAPDYKDERSGDWSCALLLLASQQYASAIWHLAESGDDVLLQAAHLTILLSAANVKVCDLGDPHPPQEISARVLEKYANALLAMPQTTPISPILMATDYLLRINNQVLCDKAIAALIVNQNFPSDLVGSLSQDGLPSSFSHLAHRVQDHTRLVAILSKAAELATSNLEDTSKVLTGIKCYMMARKYDGVVTLLKTMIAPPNVPSMNRDYWLEQATAFLESCIKPRGVVYSELEKTKNIGLVEACSTLVELNRFFRLLKQKQFNEAGKVVENLGLIPRSQHELEAVVLMYRNNLDDSIRSCYPDVLSGVMDLLYQQHNSLKRSVQSGAGSVGLKQIKQLQSQASLLVRLAGLIDADEIHRSQLSEKQALMI